MSDDTETTFPSTTFDVEFNGCGAMTADFKGDVKFKVDDLPRTLGQIHGLRCKKFQLTLVSDQSQIPDGGAADGWAHPELTDDDESDIEYERTCVGPKCRPYFCVPKEGDLVGEYVCYKDPDALMVCVRGETLCPMYPQAETVGNADDGGVDELPIEGEEVVQHTPDTLTIKELAEEFGALVIAAGDVDDMNEEDAARYNVLSDELTARGRNPHDWRRIAEDDAA